jgi:uroporphyrinogen-III synthase
VIVTSARAARALLLAAASHCGDRQNNGGGCELPVFCVGNRTWGVLASVSSVCAACPPADNAAELLAAVVARARDLGVTHDRPLLFLCGDKRLDTLPDGLRAAGIPVKELAVYATQPVDEAELAASILRALPLAPPLTGTPPLAPLRATGLHGFVGLLCCVWFSPSGIDAAAVNPLVRTWLATPTNVPLATPAGYLVRHVALGPTTAAALVRAGAAVAASAVKPDAAHVAAAVEQLLAAES